jgi:ribosomal protein S6--L-glutamate ligase
MNGWILSHLDKSPSIPLLLEACRAQGHRAQLIHPKDCLLDLVAGRPPRAASADIFPDFVITKLGSTSPAYSLSVVRQLEAAGVVCVNGSASLERSRDKVRATQELAAAGVPMPASLVPNRQMRAAEALDLLGGAPVIVKLARGTKGVGVILCESRAALQSVMDMLWGQDEEFLVQRAVTDSFGVDVRVLVVGDRAIAAMRRSATNGDFRANLAGGGVAAMLTPTREQRRIAETAASQLGLDVAGVDLLDSPREGPLLIEVNSAPGLGGITSATGRDLAGDIVRLVESKVLSTMTSAA